MTEDGNDGSLCAKPPRDRQAASSIFMRTADLAIGLSTWRTLEAGPSANAAEQIQINPYPIMHCGDRH
jgi:hypothetical protein